MKQGIRKLIAAGCLTAVFVSGCYKPTFENMEPSSIKWSMSFVSTAENEEEKHSVEQLVSEVASENGLSSAVVYSTDANALSQVTEYPGLDLVVAAADTPQIGELAAKHPELRFSLLGDTAEPKLSNVRHLIHDRKKLLFLAGFLAAEANRTSNAPFTVLVKEPRSADDADWQMILAGHHYAGRNDVPQQVTISALEGTTTGQGEVGQQNPGTSKLSGLSMVLLDPPSDRAWERLKASNQVLIRTDERATAVPLQDRVIAQPASLYEAALRQEAKLLVSGSWTGQQNVTLTGKRTFQVLTPAAFANGQIDVRLELIEEQIGAGSLNPEQYIAAVRQGNRAD
ncbi:hypothetical protein CIG75_11630 [Tumebacillus algifaecis]|uniref:ABC transporter substrate-binding protein PnrA-like domain-containing protein n=1 Tax=Tumebacillus algifaecis TaxID=1214604 RepID=A0A223D2G5_9BACL|nr:hypothetical protein [Tumebacillus algifaecis]ASS75574.1 hypothetical protein CIG75_11630 [Tumebacillus algifaecis]